MDNDDGSTSEIETALSAIPDDDYGSTRLNPFLIPHVVDLLISYSDFGDLKEQRLVSRLWRDCAKSHFERRSAICFGNFDDIETFLMEAGRDPAPAAEDDDELQPSELFCRNIRLRGPDFQPLIIMLKPLFNKYGKFIKSISISHGLGDATEEILCKIAEDVEELEELSISGVTVVYSEMQMSLNMGAGGSLGGGGLRLPFQLRTVKTLRLQLPVTCFKRWSDVRTFFTDFFATFPNVENITFLGCQFPELFRYLPEDIRFENLHSVHLQLASSSGLDLFIKRGFRLTKIVLDVEPLLGLDHLHGFLESFAHGLKYLDLRFHYKGAYNYSHNATAFPSSSSLKELISLRLYGFWGSLYFMNDFPQLRTARVERMSWDIAFPQGLDDLGSNVQKVLKFFDENGTLCDLY